MQVPLIDLKKQYLNIKQEIDSAISQVLNNAQFIIGPNVTELEKEISAFTNTKYGIGVANGTDALVMTLKALGIGQGDEVITSPYTFFASAESISAVGATPVFVDIDINTLCMDMNQLEERITSKTKAVIPVHLFGQTCDMNSLLNIANKHGLAIIEDACQAIGSTYNGKPAGSFGNAGCFSFFPTKNLGGFGDGGMIVTNDSVLAEQLRKLRVHGSPKKYHHDMVGYNSRLDELQAAILRVKLAYLDKWNELRHTRAVYYTKELQSLPLHTPTEASSCYHVYHMYIIRCENRDQLQDYLKQKGISTGVYYPLPLHLQKAYEGLGYKPGDFPQAEKACREALALPLYPEMENDEQQYVIDNIKTFFGGKSI